MKKRGEPNTPALNEISIYPDTNGSIKFKDDTGNVQPLGSIFGNEYKVETFKDFLSPSQISSETSSPFLTMITSSLPAGTYRIGWSATYRYSANARDGIFRLIVNSTEVDIQQAEGKDSGTDQRNKLCDFDEFVLSGTNEIRIDVSCKDAGDVLSIYKSKIEIWRVE
jgi:hypothetical protein